MAVAFHAIEAVAVVIGGGAGFAGGGAGAGGLLGVGAIGGEGGGGHGAGAAGFGGGGWGRIGGLIGCRFVGRGREIGYFQSVFHATEIADEGAETNFRVLESEGK